MLVIILLILSVFSGENVASLCGVVGFFYIDIVLTVFLLASLDDYSLLNICICMFDVHLILVVCIMALCDLSEVT